MPLDLALGGEGRGEGGSWFRGSCGMKAMLERWKLKLGSFKLVSFAIKLLKLLYFESLNMFELFYQTVQLSSWSCERKVFLMREHCSSRAFSDVCPYAIKVAQFFLA